MGDTDPRPSDRAGTHLPTGNTVNRSFVQSRRPPIQAPLAARRPPVQPQRRRVVHSQSPSLMSEDSGSKDHDEESVASVLSETQDPSQDFARDGEEESTGSDVSETQVPDEPLVESPIPQLQSRLAAVPLSTNRSLTNDGLRPAISSAEVAFGENNQSFEYLIALCLGQKKDDKAIVCATDESFKSFAQKSGKKKALTPKLEYLKKEIERRAKGAKVKPKNWNSTTCIAWLEMNPITDEQDIAFVNKQLDEFKAFHSRAQDLHQEPAGRQWRSALPFLRLMHCLIEDDNIKAGYLHRYGKKAIGEIDSRHSEARPLNWMELLSNKWANPNYNPKTMVSDCHEDFKKEISIGYEEVKEFTHPDAGQCESKLQQLKTSLFSLMNRWEASGSGDCGLLSTVGQRKEAVTNSENSVVTTNGDNGDIGSQETSGQIPESVPVPAESRKWGYFSTYEYTTDNRQSFLRNGRDPSYLLYYWDLMEQNGLLSATIQKLAESDGISDGDVDFTSVNYTPSFDTASTRARSMIDRHETEVLQRFDKLIQVIESNPQVEYERKKDLAIQQERGQRRNTLRDRIDDINVQIRRLKRKFERTNDKDYREDFEDLESELVKYQRELDFLEKDIWPESQSQSQLDSLQTPVRNNRSGNRGR